MTRVLPGLFKRRKRMGREKGYEGQRGSEGTPVTITLVSGLFLRVFGEKYLT